MTKTKPKSRRESKNTMEKEYITEPIDEQIYMLNKHLFYQMIETQQIEEEIMELYHQKFGIDPLDKSEKYFTEEEQIERHAQNIVFWRNLQKEYDNVDKFEQIKIPRFKYICKKEGEISMTTYIKFKEFPDVLDKISKRIKELMKINK